MINPQRDRAHARFPQILIRQALVHYHESSPDGIPVKSVDRRNFVLTAQAWDKQLWNYFPNVITPDRFYALTDLIQKRAGIDPVEHPLDDATSIIHECMTGKFQWRERERQRLLPLIESHVDYFERLARRDVLKGKGEKRDAARDRLWSFCAEPDEEAGFYILFGAEAEQIANARFAMYPTATGPLSFRRSTDERLTAEMRLLIQELRYTFLASESAKGKRCFEGHPLLIPATPDVDDALGDSPEIITGEFPIEEKAHAGKAA